jgi:hypothetical protein
MMLQIRPDPDHNTASSGAVCLPERSDELEGLAVPDLVVGPEHEAQELEGGAGVRGVRARIPELFNIRPRGVGVLG